MGLLLAVALLQGCSASRLVEPLPAGDTQLLVSLGGPIFDYQGYTIPMPLSSVAIARGVSDDLSVFAGLHTTALLYGVAQLELGLTQQLWEPEAGWPGLSWNPALNGMYDKWEHHGKVYPSFDLNAFWPVRDGRDLYYLGMSNWFELASKRDHNEPQPHHWIPAFHTGYTLRATPWSYTLELKYLAPGYSNRDIVVDYFSPSDQGALGIYFSLGRTL